MRTPLQKLQYQLVIDISKKKLFTKMLMYLKSINDQKKVKEKIKSIQNKNNNPQEDFSTNIHHIPKYHREDIT